MGLINTDVEININGRIASYYEDLGYKIPKYLDKRNNCFRVKNGTKIVVKINDLSFCSSAKVDVECDCCRKRYITTYNNYNRTRHGDKIYCKKCAIDIFLKGENNPCYKKDKTKEERERKRLYPEYTDFVKKVLARDNYTCQCCKKHGVRMEVHHLDGYDWCKERRTDDTNGITLCKTCHSNFHAIYGNGNNTKNQFEEWINSKIIKFEKYDGQISSARKIYCYEEDKIYNSATDFAKSHNIKTTTTVYFVCNNLYHCKTVKGMHLFWYDKYINLSEEEIIAKVDAPSWENSKKVICLNTNTIYNSITEGARKEQASRTSITRCCCNECQYVHTKDGRLTQWMFYNDYLKIKDLENQNMESEVY